MRKNGHNQTEAAEAAKVDQPLISRALSMDYDVLSPRMKKVCDYAKINHIKITADRPKPAQSLIDAVSRLWDGSTRGEQRIKRMLRALEQALEERPTRDQVQAQAASD